MSSALQADIVIVGAGPAGLFAGIAALETDPHARVIIVEHQKKPGRKLLVTGGGQCNFTHGGSIKDFIEHYGPAGAKIRKVLYAMSNEGVRAWFSRHGVETIERDDGKVFPRSLAAGDVLKALRESFEALGGTLLCETEPTQFDVKGGPLGCRLELLGKGGEISISAHSCIIATGGITYPKTGSDGSFVKMLEPVFKQHSIRFSSFSPALTPLYPEAYPFASLEGFSLPVLLWFEKETKAKLEQKGLLFRADSFSGPAAMDASVCGDVGDAFFINFVPDESRPAQEVAADMLKQSRLTKKEISTFVASFFDLPKKLAEALICWGMPADFKKLYARDMSKAECILLCERILHARFVVKKRGSSGEGMVSRGGVALEEILLPQMSLKKAPCIFVTGEFVDVTGDTGGYNLQWAFSSGYLAGRSAAQALLPKEL